MTFEAEWDRCAPWLQAALDSQPIQTHRLGDVLADVVARKATFWPGRNAAAVTQIDHYPLLKSAAVWLAGGDLVELRDEMGPRFEAWARENGCRFVSQTGRKGFSRALGWFPVNWTCAKELT